jgi:hypothetical protein
MRIQISAAIFLLSMTSVVAGQSPQHLWFGDTLEVEVHGLRTWDARALNDSLTRLSPAYALSNHACAAVLRRTFGFADAEVAFYISRGQPKRVVVTAIEPGDSALVQRLAAPNGAPTVPERFRNAIDIVNAKYDAVFALAQPRFLRGATDSIGNAARLASPESIQLRDEIRRATSREDLESALEIMENDSNARHRVVAAFVLSNHAQDARAWKVLLDAVRRDRNTGLESYALAAMAEAAPGTDLRPYEATLHAILGGTGLFQFTPTLRLLSSLPLEPEFARRLALAGRNLLLSNLQSRVPYRRDAARTFLEHASGKTLGDDVAGWRDWLGMSGHTN